MKRFKKLMCCIMAVGVLMSVGATSAMAASIDEAGTTELSTAFTFEYTNDPTYTVTIPSAITMTKEGTEVEIVAENVENLGGKKVSVTIAGTDKYRNQMLLEGTSDTGRAATLRYQIVLDDGSVIETTGGKDQVNGVELVSFTENGTESFVVRPVIDTISSSAIKGVTYTGSMTYGIAIAE